MKLSEILEHMQPDVSGTLQMFVVWKSNCKDRDGVSLSVVHPHLHGTVSLPNTKQLRDRKQRWRGNYAM